MEKPEAEKGCISSEETSQLNRNRSFKSKQLVRSQAIRESQSPPRTTSPAVTADTDPLANNINDTSDGRTVNEKVTCDASSHISDTCSDVISDSKGDDDGKKQPVEIQITSGSWELEAQTDQRQRTKRWLGHKHHSDSMRDLLSNNPRVTCVCGFCSNCPHCRGRRRRLACPTKQDSGIVCSEDCPDCSDSELCQNDGLRKTGSLDVEDQTFYCRCPERKEKPKSMSLSRTDSDDKTEPTGVELVNFIKETLNKNARDRMTLLKIERELHSLINDTGRCVVRFPVMTSYARMLVHRCASLFQLSHHLDQANKTCVLVSKNGTSGGRIPCTSFKQWCTVTFPPSPQRYQSDTTHAKSILKRDAICPDVDASNLAMSAARSKSLEQRERDYEKVRRRIFSSDNCNQDESQWPWLTAGLPIKLLTPETGKNKLLKVQSLESSGPVPSWRARGAVSKSHSFGGYGGQPEPQPRLLSRQGDLASSSWRLSPSSSGYKTLSLRSTDSVTPSPTGGASPEPVLNPRPDSLGVVFCVSDLSSVPTGALVIHPQTGRPLTNPDGSIYYFDPANPPVLCDSNEYESTDSKIDQNNEKRRGRLIKQHSFADNECECQPSEECRSKCCCDCRRNDTSHQRTTEKPPAEQKVSKPASPCKTRNDVETRNTTTSETSQIHYEPVQNQTNQDPPEPTNQRPPFENNVNYEAQRYEPTNQRPPFENQRSFDNQVAKTQYEPANQRPVNEIVNTRVNKLTNQESQELPYVPQQNYAQYRNDEVTSPPQMVQSHTFVQPDMVNVTTIVQAKTPVPVQEPIRPMSLTNVMYPAQAYPYPNACRIEQPLQPLYQSLVPTEEPKQLAPSPQANENTFRIDPSYPYAPVEYASQCGICVGACVDTTGLHQQRSLNVPYGQVEAAQTVLPQAYPIGNVILPQPHMQPYPYQEAVQWQNVGGLVPLNKLYVPDVCLQYPTVCPPHYSLMYPPPAPVIPQPYPICQPVYPVIEKQPEIRRNSIPNHRLSKHNSVSGSSRTTPQPTPPEDKRYEEPKTQYRGNLSRQNSNEIAQKIQQIKEQMAQMNCRERKGKEEWRRRNSGNGILGNYPVNNLNGRVGRPTNDETQLTSAARAIVNSIRNMQSKNTYPDNRRANDYNNQYRPEKPDYRRQRQEREEKRYPEHSEQKPDDRLEQDRRDARRNVNPLQFQYRPQYLLRQMSPGTWCRRSPGPVHPVLNHPRRPYPDTRNGRR